jgi:hypothetical protein
MEMIVTTMKYSKKRKNHIEKELNVRIKNRTLDKMHLKIKQYGDAGVLPYINIPEVMHTEDHGDLVFRIDKDNGTIRILKRIYEWDSDKDDIDDE